jgi:hypothetical protein
MIKPTMGPKTRISGQDYQRPQLLGGSRIAGSAADDDSDIDCHNCQQRGKHEHGISHTGL